MTVAAEPKPSSKKSQTSLPKSAPVPKPRCDRAAQPQGNLQDINNHDVSTWKRQFGGTPNLERFPGLDSHGNLDAVSDRKKPARAAQPAPSPELQQALREFERTGELPPPPRVRFPLPPSGVAPRPETSRPAQAASMKPSTEQGVRRPLSERLAATFIYTALNPIFGDTISPADAAAYCDDATRECEFSGDRIELWLLEQASALQAVSLALHGKTTAIADPVQLTAVSGAASRLTAELRRTIAALMAYRASRRRRLRSAPAETTSTKAAQAHAKRGAGSAETGTPASSPETVKGARRKAR